MAMCYITCMIGEFSFLSWIFQLQGFSHLAVQNNGVAQVSGIAYMPPDSRGHLTSLSGKLQSMGNEKQWMHALPISSQMDNF